MRYFDGYDQHGEEKGLLTNLTNHAHKSALHLVASDREPAPQTYGLPDTIVADLERGHADDDAQAFVRDRLCAQAPKMALLLIEARGLAARLGADDFLARINAVLVTSGVRPCPPR